MTRTRLDLPVPYRIANAMGAVFAAAGAPFMRLDEESIRAAAVKQTGLTDFGDPHYEEGLEALLESVERDADFHPLGRFMARDIFVNYLVQRLRLVQAGKTAPDTFAALLIPPFVVTGLARSGTTFLHRMLAHDPAHRALPQWQLLRPMPDPAASPAAPDPRPALAERADRIRRPMLPGIDAIHFTRPDSAEECILALGLTFNSLVFGTLMPVHGYTDWYIPHADSRPKYREYDALLHVFQAEAPDRRLVMKAPGHTGSLASLTRAVPDVMVVQTHRDPATCIASVCSLVRTFHLAMSNAVKPDRIARNSLALYEAWFRRNLAFRDAHPGVVYDVRYDDLVADPVGTVRGIYAHFGIPWTDAREADLREFVSRHPKGKHGTHRYSVEDFGLTDGAIRKRLGFYEDALALGP